MAMIFANNKMSDDVNVFGVMNDPGTGVDFTLLDPRATEKDIVKMLEIACDHRYYAVIVPQIHVAFAKRYVTTKLSSTLKVGTVVGFPLGTSTAKTKIREAKDAIKNGADELDVVIAIAKVKEGDYGYVKREIQRIMRIKRKIVVKAILETAFLTPEEIERVVGVLVKAKVDFVMTSTGYAPFGADIETVEKLVSLTEKTGVLVKASGGIKTKSQADNLYRLGVARIGSSRII